MHEQFEQLAEICRKRAEEEFPRTTTNKKKNKCRRNKNKTAA